LKYREKQKKYKLVETLNYKDIKNDNNASPFLKSLIKIFYDCHNIEYNDIIMFNSDFSSKI